MNVSVTIDADSVTIEARDLHPIEVGDACRHLADLAARLRRELTDETP